MKRKLLVVMGLAIGCAQGTEPLPVRVNGEHVHLALFRRDPATLELYDLAAGNWLGIPWKESWQFGAVSDDGRIRYTDKERAGIFVVFADDRQELAEGADPGDNDERVPTPRCDEIESRRPQKEPPFTVSPSGQLAYQCEEGWFVNGRALASCDREGYVFGEGDLLGIGPQGGVFCTNGVVGPDGVFRAYSGLPEEVYVDRSDEHARNLVVVGVRMGRDGIYVLANDSEGLKRYAVIDELGSARPGPGGRGDGEQEYRRFDIHSGNPLEGSVFLPNVVRFATDGAFYVPLGPYLESEHEIYRFSRIYGDESARLEFPDVADVHYALQTP